MQAMIPKRFENKNYYEILGINQDATRDEIAKTYRDLCRIYHPDSNYYADIIDDPPNEEHMAIFRMITDAYNVLIDEEARAKYNDELFYKSHRRLTQVTAVNFDTSHPSLKGVSKTGREQVLKVAPLFAQGTPESHSLRLKAVEKDWAENVPSISQIMRAQSRAPSKALGPILGGVIFGLIVGIIAISLAL